MEQSRKQWMRQEATNIFELTKGHIPEQIDQYDNAMKCMLNMAGFVLELTNDTSSPSPVEVDKPDKLDFIMNMTGIKPRIIGPDVFYLTSQVRTILEKWDALSLTASSGETMRWVRWEDKPPYIGQILYIKELINGNWQRQLIFHDCATSPTDETMKQRGVFYLDETVSSSDTREEPFDQAMVDAVYEGAALWQQEYDACRKVLQELVTLKMVKDKEGKTEEYQQRQPEAWKVAVNFLNEYQHFVE